MPVYAVWRADSLIEAAPRTFGFCIILLPASWLVEGLAHLLLSALI
jgi:hypothetical protein